MGIFDAMFRNKIGAPSKKELYDNRVSVYEKIVKIKNDMENQAMEDFQNSNNSSWLILQAKEKQINNQFINGDISEEDYLDLINACREAMKDAVASYIDGQDEKTVYGILKNSRIITSKEALKLLSDLRLGVSMNMLKDIKLEKVQSLITQIEPYTLRKILGSNFNEQEENIIYGILKNSLRRIKKENIHLQNIDKMKFDWWRQIEASAELAQLTIAQIVNSGEYSQAARDNKQIMDYQVRRRFKR